MFTEGYNWISDLTSLLKLQNILVLVEKVNPNATLKFLRDFTDQSTADIASSCYLGMKKMEVISRTL